MTKKDVSLAREINASGTLTTRVMPRDSGAAFGAGGPAGGLQVKGMPAGPAFSRHATPGCMDFALDGP